MRGNKRERFAKKMYCNAISDPEVDYLEWESVRESVVEQCELLLLEPEPFVSLASEYDEEMSQLRRAIKGCEQ